MSAQTHNALLSAMTALLLMTTMGQSAMLTDQLPTTGSPDPLTSHLTTQLTNSSTEEPRVLRLSRSCRTEDKDFCKNGGKCMYHQDIDKPFCHCQSSYSGERCMFIEGLTYAVPEWEQLIGIGFGVAVLILVLVFIVYCLASKRCIKSAPFKEISQV